jgi:hypothetical protein
MKNKYLLIIYYLVHSSISFSQTTNWQWAKGATDPGFEEGYGVAADKSGNVYLVGEYDTDTCTFDTINLLTGGNQTGFIVKYGPSGNVLWAQSITNAGDNYAWVYAVATDPNNNVYVTGRFQGSIKFADSVLLSAQAGNDQSFFVAKYDSTGKELWAQVGGGNGQSWAQSVAADKNGVYITGYDDGWINTFSDSVQTDGGGFIARYNPGGQALWASVYTVTSMTTLYGVATDSKGNVYATGGDGSVVIAKYDSSGNQLWFRSVLAGSDGTGNGAATDTSGNVYITGYFQSDSIVFGSQVLYHNPTNYGDCFLAKYDSKGNAIWARHATGTGGQIGYGVAVDKEGNVFISGSLGSDTLTFDSSVVIFFPSDGGDAMFVATYDENGNIMCASALSSGGDDQNGITVDNRGNAYTGGDFEVNPFVVGRDTLILPANGGGGNEETAFVAKFSCGPPVPENIRNITDNYSLQLHPNPFTTQAIVQYALPDGSKNATLIIYDIMGRKLNSYALNNTTGEITINANTLSSGVYLYSLVANGKTIATKKMVIQE